MSFAKEEHTDTGLTNSSADGIRKCSIDDGFLEWQIPVSYTHLDVYKRQDIDHTDQKIQDGINHGTEIREE